jgi:hypothetical protein
MRCRQTLSAFVFVAALSLWTGGVSADSMLHLTLGSPDITTSFVSVNYDSNTEVLTASGMIGSLDTSPGFASSNFYLNALVDHSGNLINNSANLKVDYMGDDWFESGALDPMHLGTVGQNSNPVAFGFGTGTLGLMEFEFSQNPFGQHLPVPAAGTLIGVELHASFSGFGNSFMINMGGTTDTAPVVAPAPQVAASGAGLLGAIATFMLLRKRSRRSVA